MFCPKCGAKTLDGAGFCQKCGTKLIVDDAVQESTGMAGHQAQPDKVQTSKKKRKKLPIILCALAVLVLLLIIISSLGGNDRQVNTNGVNLSETYTNQNEGISFKYPKAWVLVSEEEFSGRFGSVEDEEYPLVLLANETDDLPEANTYIMVSKFPATQDVIDHLFIDDEQFAATFDNDVTVKSTSTTEIDGVAARKITYLTSDGIGYQSYFYAVGSMLYRIDFSWMGESSGNNQRFFDAIIGSYEITPPETTAVADTSGKLLLKNIPVEEIMQMTSDEIIAAFGEPDIHEPDIYYDSDRIEYESDQLCFIMSEYGGVFSLDAPAEKFTMNGQSLNQDFDILISLIGDDYSALGGAGYQWSIGDLSCTFHISPDDGIADIIEVSKVDTDDPIDNDAYLGDESNYGTYGNLDSALVGRWRSHDGGTLQFDDSGAISSCDFKCWSMNGEPERVYWEASNGRVTCSAYFDENVTYEISKSADGYDMVGITFPDARNWTQWYQRTSGSTGNGIIGTWASMSNTSWSFEFNEDGTGLDSGKYPFTWYAYTTDEGINAMSYTLLDSTYFDYSISGNTLTVFLSDGGRVYTKVGN